MSVQIGCTVCGAQSPSTIDTGPAMAWSKNHRCSTSALLDAVDQRIKAPRIGHLTAREMDRDLIVMKALRDRVENLELGDPLRLRYPEVDRFADRMLGELAANSHKGDQAGWRRMTIKQAWVEISWHLGKLTAAMKAGDVPKMRELAADVANGAMMFDDILAQREGDPWAPIS